MNFNIKDINPCKKNISFDIPVEEINADMEEYYSQAAKNFSMPGFRPGKVPMSLIRSKFQKEARTEVVKHLVSKSYIDAINKENLNPLMSPEIENMVDEDGKPLSFEVNVEVEPEVKLPAYDKIKVTQTIDENVNDKDLEAFLGNLRDSKATYEETTEGVIDWGDYVQCDYTLKDGDNEIETKTDHWFVVINQPIMENFFSPIVGLKVGDKTDGKATLDEKFPNKDAAGKEVAYSFEVKAIKKKTLPPMDDALAADFQLDTLDALKERISEYFKAEKENQAKMEIEHQIADYLIDNCDAPMPEDYYARKVEGALQDHLGRMVQQGVKGDELEKAKEETRAKLEDEVKQALKLQFMVSAIFEKEDLKLERHEIQNRQRKILSEINPAQKELIKAWSSDAGTAIIIQNLKREKVMEKLVETADVKKDIKAD